MSQLQKAKHSKTLDEAWKLIKEVIKIQKSFAKKIDQMAQENLRREKKEAEQRKKEAEQRKKEAEQRKKEAEQRKKEAEQKKKEAEQRKKELARREKQEEIWRNDLADLSNFLKKEAEKSSKRLAQMEDNWGKLVESLVKGGLVKLLKGIGIKVNDVMSRREKFWKGQEYEFDLIAKDGQEEVVCEVKTTLRNKDIDRFIKKLQLYKEIFSKEDKIVYGAMAFIHVNESSDKVAMKKGLIVIKGTGDGATIINKPGFKPIPF